MSLLAVEKRVARAVGDVRDFDRAVAVDHTFELGKLRVTVVKAIVDVERPFVCPVTRELLHVTGVMDNALPLMLKLAFGVEATDRQRLPGVAAGTSAPRERSREP